MKIIADEENLENKDQEYFSNKNFDLVCALVDDFAQLERIDNLTRAGNVLFLAGYVYGLHGYMFVDFNEYQFIVY